MNEKELYEKILEITEEVYSYMIEIIRKEIPSEHHGFSFLNVPARLLINNLAILSENKLEKESKESVYDKLELILKEIKENIIRSIEAEKEDHIEK